MKDSSNKQFIAKERFSSRVVQKAVDLFVASILRKRFAERAVRRVYGEKFMGELISRDRNHLWLIAMQKSGSTWLTKLLQDLLGWKSVKLVPYFNRRDQEFDVRQILAEGAANGDLFSPQQHCRYHAYVHHWIEHLNIKPVIQVRNIFDVIVSNKDHCDNESLVFPMAYMNDSWGELSDSDKLDCIIDMVAPWYFNFFCGWMDSPLHRSGRLHWVTYESLVEDTSEVLQGICKFAGVERSEERVRESIEKSNRLSTRKNRGTTGRGLDLLSSEQREKLVKYASYYKNTDFSLIGL